MGNDGTRELTLCRNALSDLMCSRSSPSDCIVDHFDCLLEPISLSAAHGRPSLRHWIELRDSACFCQSQPARSVHRSRSSGRAFSYPIVNSDSLVVNVPNLKCDPWCFIVPCRNAMRPGQAFLAGRAAGITITNSRDPPLVHLPAIQTSSYQLLRKYVRITPALSSETRPMDPTRFDIVSGTRFFLPNYE
jgi:hypothetical protein